ncbi:GNAT family N-acetyltransferase [Lysinibacillus halotolerans]|uniref:GNAT family N-acetyltransferase n=1 Tax=Lysinibacillus halotolerans TaxID=1368476 RepID=A0A3M8HFQ6_9BACI|nr:GNAT family N-acetyltransferase [Lysinibacillus halotolerans]RND01189.1 GNAT family N-acetyltransferase [Lysinibacillus halotolerans]
MKILLKRMSEREFTKYFENKVERYAEVLSQNVHEEVDEQPKSKAYRLLHNLLPKGVETPDHHLFHILNDDQMIGYVWIKVEKEKKSAFLYEIYLFERFRGMGFGTKVMTTVEEWIHQQGIAYFKLHVFGSNTGARKLYEELGFEIAGINMMKKIN